nr:unnamed protein product [Spirometra erinaceieuropaei]
MRRGRGPPPRYSQDEALTATPQEATSNELARRLANEDASVENRWCQLRDTVQSSGLALLDHALRQHQDLFDDNNIVISKQLVEKDRLHKTYVNRPTDNETAFHRSRRLLQKWQRGSAPLLIVNETTLLTEKTQILQRWVEHFRGVLDHPSAIYDPAINQLTRVETNADPNLPPTLHETIRAVHQLSSEQAPGSNAIRAEICKHGGPNL